jgi:Tfp pilus tip-associated adhesin PilY1
LYKPPTIVDIFGLRHPTPRIIRIKHNGKDKWVAVFGGGYNGSVNPNYGSAVFVMDLEDEGRL